MAAPPKRVKDLSILGKKIKRPLQRLEVFPNKTKERYFLVTLKTDEFTCLCPVTGQPDFAKIEIRYVPDKKILESKSLKLYLWSFRQKGVFHEHVINRILDDIVKAVAPHWCLVTGIFNIRGGIGITVDAEHIKTKEARSLWKPKQ